MENLKTIAKINKTSILLIENGEKLIPIKPICEALGIAHQPQIDKIGKDDILSSVVTLSMTTGSDKKQYQMVCLPLKFTFGWLFTINPKNVAPEAKDTVLKFKLECYEALYRHFTNHTNFLEQKQKIVTAQNDEVDKLKKDFNEANAKLQDAKKRFKDAMEYPFEEWLANDRQLKLEFE